jgi:hypothetical protein
LKFAVTSEVALGWPKGGVLGLRAVRASLLAAWLCLIGTDAFADDWQFNPQIEVGGQASDNYRLNLPGAQQHVAGAFTDARLQLRSVNDLSDFRLTPGVHATLFPNSRHNDSTDPFVDLDWNYRGQTMNTGLTAEFSKRSVVTSLNPSAIESTTTGGTGTGTATGAGTGTAPGGLGNPGTGASGSVNVENRERLIIVDPGLDIEVSPQRRVELRAHYENQAFDQNIPGTSVGSKSIGGTVGLAQDLTPRDTLSLRGTYSHDNPDGDLSKTSSYGIQGEWSRRFTQISQTYLRMGGDHTNFQAATGVVAHGQTTWVAGAGIQWDFQTSQLFLDGTRSVDPSSTGVTVQHNELRVRATHSFAALVKGFGSVSTLSENSTGGGSGFRKRNYTVGNLGLQWRFLREWTVQGTYTYVRQKFDGNPADQIANSASLSVVYQPHRDRRY